MSATQQQISSMRKVELTIAFFLQEDAALVESTADSCIKFLPLKIVRPLIKPKIFLEEHVLVALDRI